MVIFDKYFILAFSVYYDYVWWLFYVHWLLLADIYDEEDDDPDTIPDEDTNLQDGTPDWVKSEKDQFINHRDKNMDGKLDEEEVKAWVIPEDYDHSASEALHLVNACDSNKDGKLSRDEILEHYDLFVGSQATDFGEALTRHDEF